MTNRLGYVRKYTRSGATFASAGDFVDIRDRVLTAFNGVPYGEMGLLGLALHPKFNLNGTAFLYYSAAGTQGTAVEARLSRFVSRNGGLTLDPTSEEVLLRVPRTSQFHWGGTLGFGPDGHLYIAFGDGNEKPKAQALDSLLGKMLRINVDAATGYTVPPDNPFVGNASARPEIYALGFRNPWKWSIDRATRDIWLGDVGQSDWEEINKVVRGGNYGWPVREGKQCTGVMACTTAGLIDPILAYSHAAPMNGSAIIGGFVYSGIKIPSLRGSYVFADAGGKVLALRYTSNGVPYTEQLADIGPIIQTFAQDENGEMYVATGGNVLALSAAGSPVVSTFPERLSQTGCMQPANPALPVAGLIPYSVNSPLWSDGAGKERWFALPNGTTINRLSDGDWDLPVGSVTVKSFRLNNRLVETRLFVRHDDGDWAGYTYEWNDAQTDAVLVDAGGKTKSVDGKQWLYPSRSQCMACHTEAAGRTLGLETAQLNRNQFYPTTGRTANQLATLNAVGLFFAPLNVSPDQLDKLADPANLAHGLELRARSYLHANCAYCHRPNGPGQGPEDFRYSLASTSIGAINVIPTQSSFGIPDARLITPGKPDKSIVRHRLQTLDLGRMPPLGTSVVDTEGLALVSQWIRSGLGMGSPDSDGDGFASNVDNCPKTANPSQLDSDGDGIGNQCDADFNNDGFVNSLDLGLLQKAMGSVVGQAAYDARIDMNGDGRINALDLGLFRSRFGKPPGDF